ncbi:2533_t:CDS:2, partial [Paraglomus occultum]
MFDVSNFRVVVGIDFGTIYSGYAFANKTDPDEIISQDTWPDQKGTLRTPTVLQYDNHWNVFKWGYPALTEYETLKKKKISARNETQTVEMFKLHLIDTLGHQKPPLPKGLTCWKAITDYLKALNQSIKKTLLIKWPELHYHSQVLKIMTIPAELDGNTLCMMRKCAYEAEIINTLDSKDLVFATEPEATAIYCVRSLNLKPGSAFLVVDCDLDTVDLTLRTFLATRKLSKVTDRTGDFCGSTFVDREFIKYIASVVGESAMRIFKEKHKVAFQYMIKQFCDRVKFVFDGDREKFETTNFEFDVGRFCPELMQYVQGDKKKRMKEEDWIIELDYETVKSCFDPVVNRILQLIETQLGRSRLATSAIFLVGELSESIYLLQRVRRKFSSKVDTIAVPPFPLAAVARGAVYYGLDISFEVAAGPSLARPSFEATAGPSLADPSLGVNAVTTRVVKRYGIKFKSEWKPGDPLSRRTADGHIYVFKTIAQREIMISDDSEFTYELIPSSNQTQVEVDFYTTCRDDVRYCDELGVVSLGQLLI